MIPNNENSNTDPSANNQNTPNTPNTPNQSNLVVESKTKESSDEEQLEDFLN